MKAGVFEIHKLELELDSISISELQRRVGIAEMQVKDKVMRVKELQDMMVVTEAEKDGKVRDIEKLDSRLQAVMTTLREKQEDLQAMHIVKNQAEGNSEKDIARDLQDQLIKLMGSDDTSEKKKKLAQEDFEAELQDVEIECDDKETMRFRVTTGLDFHALLINAIEYYNVAPEDMPVNLYDENFQLVGAQGLQWPLEERVQDYLSSQGEGWFIKLERKTFEEEVDQVEEEEIYSSSEDEDKAQVNLLVYPPKQRRSSIIVEMIGFIIFTVLFFIVMYSGRNIENHQLIYQVHREYLIEQEYGDLSILKYYDIATWEEFWMWMEGPLTQGLFPHAGDEFASDKVIGAPASELAEYNKLVGGVKLNQNRVKRREFEHCGLANKRMYQRRNNETKDVDNFFDYCYPSYSKKNRETADFSRGEEVYGFFYRNAQYTYKTTGYYGSYDNHGFMYEVDDIDPAGENFLTALDELKSNNWIDKQTRAVTVEILTYNANVDIYCNVIFLIEFTASGFILPSFWIDTFSVDMWEGWQRNNPYATNILELLICSYILLFIYLEKKELAMAHKITGGIKAYFKQLWNVVDMLTILLYIFSQLVRLWFFFVDRRRKFNPFRKGYMEYTDIARVYQLQYQVDAAIVMLLAFKLFKYFQLSSAMGMLWKVLASAGTSILYFLVMWTMIMVGFALMGLSLFGSSLRNYSSFIKALISLLLALLGEIDYEDMILAQPFFGPFFFVLFIVLVYFVLLNIFLAILNEAYATESARLQEEQMLGGKKGVNKLKSLLRAVKSNMRERKRAKAEAKAEEDAFLEMLKASEQKANESKEKAKDLKQKAKKTT